LLPVQHKFLVALLSLGYGLSFFRSNKVAHNGCEHVTLRSKCLRTFRKIIFLDLEKRPGKKMQQFYMLAVTACCFMQFSQYFFATHIYFQ